VIINMVVTLAKRRTALVSYASKILVRRHEPG
jgi:hypothetical protein